MRNLKKFTRAFALAMALTMAVPAGLPVSNAVVAEAATVKLSATKKTLTVGKTYTLKVKGTTKKVTWKSSKKSVATVSSKGKVTAKKAGTATITAKVGTKSYKCKVTVKNAVNKYVAKAPFEAKEVKVGKYTMAAPKDWVMETTEKDGAYVCAMAPAKEATSNIIIAVQPSAGAEEENFDVMKAVFKEMLTEQMLEDTLKATAGGEADIKDFTMTDEELKSGKAMVISYTADITIEGITASVKQDIYLLFANGCIAQVTVTGFGGEEAKEISEIGEYMANSLIYVK